MPAQGRMCMRDTCRRLQLAGVEVWLHPIEGAVCLCVVYVYALSLLAWQPTWQPRMPSTHHTLTSTPCRREAAEVSSLSVQDLAEKLAAASAGGDSDTQFVDVREEGELRLAALPGFQLFPLSRCVGGGCAGRWVGDVCGRRAS